MQQQDSPSNFTALTYFKKLKAFWDARQVLSLKLVPEYAYNMCRDIPFYTVI